MKSNVTAKVLRGVLSHPLIEQQFFVLVCCVSLFTCTHACCQGLRANASTQLEHYHYESLNAIFISAVTSQVTQSVPQAPQGAAVVPGQQIQGATCPLTCSFDCNPASCPLKCCSNLVRKTHIARKAKPNLKLSSKKSRKNKKRSH